MHSYARNRMTISFARSTRRTGQNGEVWILLMLMYAYTGISAIRAGQAPDRHGFRGPPVTFPLTGHARSALRVPALHASAGQAPAPDAPVHPLSVVRDK